MGGFGRFRLKFGFFSSSNTKHWDHLVVQLPWEAAGWIVFHRCIYWILLVLQCSKGRYLKFERFDSTISRSLKKKNKLHPRSVTCFSCASDSLFSVSNSCDLGDSGTIILPSNPQGFSPARWWKLLKEMCAQRQSSHGNHGSHDFQNLRICISAAEYT